MEEQTPISPTIPPQAVPPPAAPISPPPVAPVAPVVKKGTSSALLAILGIMMVGGIAFAALTLWQKGLLGGFLAKPTPTPTLAPEPTPTPNPTADWQTYTNAQMGISLKHPKEYFVKKQESQSAEFYSQLEESDLPKLKIIKGFIGGGGCEYKVSSEDVIVGGEKGELTITTAVNAGPECKNPSPVPSADYSARVSLTRNQTLWLLEMNIKTNNKEEEIRTFKTILSTFEFLTPTPTGTQTKGGITQGTPVKIKSISLVSPTKGPLVIKGTVESGWMFEGVMPVKLLDASRQEIASGSATETVPGSWQSGKPVEFSVSLTFTTDSSSGFLIFENDNPSGLPQNAKSFELPVKFRQ
jgi:hypothetical protein